MVWALADTMLQRNTLRRPRALVVLALLAGLAGSDWRNTGCALAAASVSENLLASQGVVPEPETRTLQRERAPKHGQDLTASDIQPEDLSACRQDLQGGGDETVASLKALLSAAEGRAKQAAQRAEAAFHAARAELEKTTKVQTRNKEAEEHAALMAIDLATMKEKAERSEAVSDELQMRLKITDDKLKRTEMKLQELSAAKASVDIMLRKSRDDHASMLRRMSADKETHARDTFQGSRQHCVEPRPQQNKVEVGIAAWFPPILLKICKDLERMLIDPQHFQATRRFLSSAIQYLERFESAGVYSQFEERVSRIVRSNPHFVLLKNQARPLSIALLGITGILGIAMVRKLTAGHHQAPDIPRRKLFSKPRAPAVDHNSDGSASKSGTVAGSSASGQAIRNQPQNGADAPKPAHAGGSQSTSSTATASQHVGKSDSSSKLTRRQVAKK